MSARRRKNVDESILSHVVCADPREGVRAGILESLALSIGAVPEIRNQDTEKGGARRGHLKARVFEGLRVVTLSSYHGLGRVQGVQGDQVEVEDSRLDPSSVDSVKAADAEAGLAAVIVISVDGQPLDATPLVAEHRLENGPGKARPLPLETVARARRNPRNRLERRHRIRGRLGATILRKVSVAKGRNASSPTTSIPSLRKQRLGKRRRHRSLRTATKRSVLKRKLKVPMLQLMLRPRLRAQWPRCS